MVLGFDIARRSIGLRPMHLDIDCAITPRPYQQGAFHAGLESLKRCRRTLIVLPTGTGKTVVFSLVARFGLDRGRRILVLVDRDELVRQAVRRLREDVDIHAEVEKAHLRASFDAQVVVASVQTLSRIKRLRRWAPDHFDLVIPDEAHHAVAPGWRRVLDWFESAKCLGVTATPDRADGKILLKEVFDEIAFEMNAREAIQGGWLVPVRQLFVQVNGLDFSEIRRGVRDLNQGDLEAVVRNADILERMAVPTMRLSGDRPTIIFCVGVAHAHAFVEYLLKRGKRAAVIDEQTSNRASLIDAFRAGELQYLASVGCLNEGFDAPVASAVAMLRTTCSRGLYAQQIGRGMRPLPGVVDGLHTAAERRAAIAASPKPECLVLDFVGNSGRHKLVHAAEAIEPYAEKEVIEKAERLMEQQGLEVSVALDMAKKLVEEARRRPVDGDQGMLEFSSEEVDPFDHTPVGRTLKLFDVGRQKDPWQRKITSAQAKTLERFGVKDAGLLNRIEASALLDELIPRTKKGLATPRQVEALLRAGLDRAEALQMTFEQASRRLDRRPCSDAQRKLLRDFGYSDEQLAEMTSADASVAIDAVKQNGWKRPGAAS